MDPWVGWGIEHLAVLINAGDGKKEKAAIMKGGEEYEVHEERERRSVSAEPILQKKPSDPR